VEIPQLLFNTDIILKFKSFVSVLKANYIFSCKVNGTLNEKGESVKRYYSIAATLHTNEAALSNLSNYSKSFFLIPKPLYVLTVWVEAYCCTWPHSMTHTHTHTHTHRGNNTNIHSVPSTNTQTLTLGSTTLVERSDLARTSTRQHKKLTRERHRCHRRDSNSQSQKAFCPITTPYTVRPPASDNCSKSEFWIKKSITHGAKYLHIYRRGIHKMRYSLTTNIHWPSSYTASHNLILSRLVICS
jgi:hypothetical protein